jgi:hypothetical protein
MGRDFLSEQSLIGTRKIMRSTAPEVLVREPYLRVELFSTHGGSEIISPLWMVNANDRANVR